MKRLLQIFAALSLFVPVYSGAVTDTELCVQKCLDPEVVTPPAISVFPHKITFENSADQANGNAAILFRTIPDGTVRSVTVNGEAARLGRPYKGASVFLLGKPGNQYSRPLKFTITATDGTVYIATSSTSSPTTPSGKNSESIKPSSCGNPEGANCRQNMRAAHPGSYYGLTPTVNCDGDKYYIKNSSKRQEESGGWIWKPVSDSNGKLVIVGKHGKKYQACTVIW